MGCGFESRALRSLPRLASRGFFCAKYGKTNTLAPVCWDSSAAFLGFHATTWFRRHSPRFAPFCLPTALMLPARFSFNAVVRLLSDPTPATTET